MQIANSCNSSKDNLTTRRYGIGNTLLLELFPWFHKTNMYLKMYIQLPKYPKSFYISRGEVPYVEQDTIENHF